MRIGQADLPQDLCPSPPALFLPPLLNATFPSIYFSSGNLARGTAGNYGDLLAFNRN